MKRIIPIILTLIILCGIVSTAHAAQTENINVTYGVNIKINSILFQPTDVNSNKVEPFIYGGTTYVPLRAISELFGVGIGWENSTVILDTSTKHELRHNGNTATAKTKSQASITVVKHMNLLVDNIALPPTDVNGNQVPIILYNGTNYVPLRFLSNLFGAEVDWDLVSYTAIISRNVDTSGYNEYQVEALPILEEINNIMQQIDENIVI